MTGGKCVQGMDFLLQVSSRVLPIQHPSVCTLHRHNGRKVAHHLSLFWVFVVVLASRTYHSPGTTSLEHPGLA